MRFSRTCAPHAQHTCCLPRVTHGQHAMLTTLLCSMRTWERRLAGVILKSSDMSARCAGG